MMTSRSFRLNRVNPIILGYMGYGLGHMGRPLKKIELSEVLIKV